MRHSAASRRRQMGDNNKTKKQLIEELEALRRRVAEPEGAGTEQAKDMPQQGQGYFQSLVANATDAIAILDADGSIRYEEGQGLYSGRILGYEPQDRVGKTMLDFVHPDDVPMIANLFLELMQKPGSSLSAELRVQHKNGLWHNVEVMARNLIDDPTVKGIVVNFCDISERIRMQEELRLKGKALNSSLAAIAMSDMKGMITYVNQACLRLWGKDNIEDLIGTPFWHLLDAATPATEIKDIAKSMVKKGYWRGELVAKRQDGTEVQLESLSSLIKDEQGNPIQTISSFIDITEHKRMEEELRRSEQDYRILFETTLEGVVVVDGETMQIALANEAAARIYGFNSAKEAIGMNMVDFLHPDDRDRVIGIVIEEVFGKGISPIIEARTLSKEGKEIWISCLGVRTEYQGRMAMLISLRDITVQKQAEAKLNKAMAELTRSNTELEQFAYVASHDLQEPLRMVTSYTQLLERRYRDKLDGDADEFMGYIVEGAKRMQQLINDFLTFSRLGTRGKPFEPTDCGAVLNQAIANLQAAIENNKAVVAHDPMPNVMADGSQLVQLFQNLIGNAIKFHGDKRPEVHVGAECKGPEWVFSVRDNGIGIDSKYYERIFVIFQRLHGRTEYSGTGIGLAICKKIVERHKGRIWVESQVGMGSTFYFTIPTKAEEKHE